MFAAGRRIGVALGLAGVLLSAACGGSAEEPRRLPPVSTTSSPTPSASASYDEKAALEAATAVVREYFRLLNNLDQSMDVANFDAIETANCDCRKFLESLQHVHARGEHYFGHARIGSLTPASDSEALVEVLVSYDASISGIKDADDRVLSRNPPRTDATELFYVKRTGDRWLIDKILVIKRGKSS